MVNLDIAQFRVDFKEYADTGDYPDALITSNFEVAELYLNNYDYGYLSPALSRALYLMTAHQMRINDAIANGDTGLLTTSSSIGAVSVTATPPQTQNEFTYWLSTTPYGIQLLALLKAYSAGGFIIGGRPIRSAFRKYDGSF